MTTKRQIERDRDALVLVGPKGTARTKAAQAAATALGGYVELDACCLDFDSVIQHMLAQQPACCIVEGIPSTHQGLTRLKQLITSEQVQLRQPGVPARLVKTPTFIIHTDDNDGVKHMKDDRRFFVVPMPIEKQKGGAKCA